jgi:hypothetical protein
MAAEAQGTPGQFWEDLVRNSSADAFCAAFTPTATLETAVTNMPIQGARAIRVFMLAIAAFYERLRFTSEVRADGVIYLEWDGIAFGEPVAGITTFHHDAAGGFETIRLQHRRLCTIVRFARELARELDGQFPADLFALD